MIYITVPFSEMDAANLWVKENVDPASGDVFIHNYVDACVISLPDNGSAYNATLMDHFGYFTEKPDLEPLPSDR